VQHSHARLSLNCFFNALNNQRVRENRRYRVRHVNMPAGPAEQTIREEVVPNGGHGMGSAVEREPGLFYPAAQD
jgi:hypothetical protein